jgi:uncharacterized protein YndB with AHSA1/START domain
MTHITTSLVIRAPQDETFDYLTDLRHAQEWSTELVDVTYDGDLGAGTTGADTRRLGRRTVVMPWTVTAYDRPRRIVLEYGPPFPATAEFSFRPAEGGTQVTCDTDLRPRGLWRLLTPLMAAEARKSDAAQFQKVKAILEGRNDTGTWNSEGARHV